MAQGRLLKGVHDLGTEVRQMVGVPTPTIRSSRGAKAHTQWTVPVLVGRNQMLEPSASMLRGHQVLVEIEAEEAGEQLAGSSPPDDVS